MQIFLLSPIQGYLPFVSALQIAHIRRYHVGQTESLIDISPSPQLAYFVVTPISANGNKEAMQINVNVGDCGHAVHGRAAVVHELVKLRHESILYLTRKIVRTAALLIGPTLGTVTATTFNNLGRLLRWSLFIMTSS